MVNGGDLEVDAEMAQPTERIRLASDQRHFGCSWTSRLVLACQLAPEVSPAAVASAPAQAV